MEAELLRAVKDGFAEAMRILTWHSRGTLSEEDGLLLYSTPTPSPFPWNGAIRVVPGLAVEQLVSRADRFFSIPGRPYAVMALEGLDDDLVAALGEASRTASQMVLDRHLQPRPTPPGTRLEIVNRSSLRNDFLTVVGEAFEPLGEAPDTWGRCYPTVGSLANPETVTMVLYEGSTPVSAGLFYRAGGLIEILHVATRPVHRKKGYARAVTAALTIHGFETGASLASLQAKGAAVEICESLGYRVISTHNAYLRSTPDV